MELSEGPPIDVLVELELLMGGSIDVEELEELLLSGGGKELEELQELIPGGTYVQPALNPEAQSAICATQSELLNAIAAGTAK